MVVQYKGGTRYLCSYLRQQFHEPGCQYLPADPINAQVLKTFFPAVLLGGARCFHRGDSRPKPHAKCHDRSPDPTTAAPALSGGTGRAAVPPDRPDNRLVAAELERRWEEALREFQQVETRLAERHPGLAGVDDLPPELCEAFMALGQRLPAVWHQGLLAREQQKALLRCLIDKVAVHRAASDRLHLRIVWKGAQVSVFEPPFLVSALADYFQAGQ